MAAQFWLALLASTWRLAIAPGATGSQSLSFLHEMMRPDEVNHFFDIATLKAWQKIASSPGSQLRIEKGGAGWALKEEVKARCEDAQWNETTISSSDYGGGVSCVLDAATSDIVRVYAGSKLEDAARARAARESAAEREKAVTTALKELTKRETKDDAFSAVTLLEEKGGRLTDEQKKKLRDGLEKFQQRPQPTVGLAESKSTANGLGANPFFVPPSYASIATLDDGSVITEGSEDSITEESKLLPAEENELLAKKASKEADKKATIQQNKERKKEQKLADIAGKRAVAREQQRIGEQSAAQANSQPDSQPVAQTGRQIFIKCLDGRTITIEVTDTTTEDELRQKVAEKLRVPLHAIERFIFQGKQLADGATLEGVGKEATVHLLWRARGGIIVRTPSTPVAARIIIDHTIGGYPERWRHRIEYRIYYGRHRLRRSERFVVIYFLHKNGIRSDIVYMALRDRLDDPNDSHQKNAKRHKDVHNLLRDLDTGVTKDKYPYFSVLHGGLCLPNGQPHPNGNLFANTLAFWEKQADPRRRSDSGASMDEQRKYFHGDSSAGALNTASAVANAEANRLLDERDERGQQTAESVDSTQLLTVTETSRHDAPPGLAPRPPTPTTARLWCHESLSPEPEEPPPGSQDELAGDSQETQIMDECAPCAKRSKQSERVLGIPVAPALTIGSGVRITVALEPFQLTKLEGDARTKPVELRVSRSCELLARFPDGFFDLIRLNTIVLCENLKHDGTVRGHYWTKGGTMFIDVSDERLRQLGLQGMAEHLAHELGHMWHEAEVGPDYETKPFPMLERYNPPGFTYGNEHGQVGGEHMRQPGSDRRDTAPDDCVLSAYAGASRSEDIAELVRAINCKPHELDTDALRAKASVILFLWEQRLPSANAAWRSSMNLSFLEDRVVALRVCADVDEYDEEELELAFLLAENGEGPVLSAAASVLTNLEEFVPVNNGAKIVLSAAVPSLALSPLVCTPADAEKVAGLLPRPPSPGIQPQPDPPTPLQLTDLASELLSHIKDWSVRSLPEGGSVLDAHALGCTCKAFDAPVSVEAWWALFARALLKPGADDPTQKPTDLALHSLAGALASITLLHEKQGGSRAWLADAMKAEGYDGPLGLNLEGRLILLCSTVRARSGETDLQLALSVVPRAYERPMPSVRARVDPAKQGPECLTNVGCQVLAQFEFISEPPHGCSLVALVGCNGQLWAARVDDGPNWSIGDVHLLSTSAERVLGHSLAVSFDPFETVGAVYPFARDDKVLRHLYGFTTLGASSDDGRFILSFASAALVPALRDWSPAVCVVSLVLDENDNVFVGFPSELLERMVAASQGFLRSLDKDGMCYLPADDTPSLENTHCPADLVLHSCLRHVLQGARPIVVQPLAYKDLSDAQPRMRGGDGHDGGGSGDDNASTVPEEDGVGELIEELESPDDAAPAGVAAGPLHQPDPDEGEFEGTCNVCGGSHMYCRVCGVSYCIMCEEAGCEGEPYGVHDSSQSADGRHESGSE